MNIHETKNTAKKSKNPAFRRVSYNVAGIDIGSNSSFVCIGFTNGEREIREYSAFTGDIKAMAFWLKKNKVKSVVMESTGVYWIPIYDILEEEGIQVMLVDARHVKAVPGRKSDVQDSQWLQELHAHGLLRGAFRPDKDIVTLRTYGRQRTKQIELAAMQKNLMHKALTQMNLQLNLVISDITGDTGMQILKAIIRGERCPIKLAQLRNFRCRKSVADIAQALEGNFKPELVFSLQQAVETYEFLRNQANKCEKEMEILLEQQILARKHQFDSSEEESKPKQKPLKSNPSSYNFDVAGSFKKIVGIDLQEIPGFDGSIIMRILSETGTDMHRWPNAKHFASWLGLCSNNKISGGKILSSRTTHTTNRAAQGFRMAAQTLWKSSTALGAFFRRIRSRLGSPKAITATAHKLAIIMYHMIKRRAKFKELGQDTYEKQYKARVIKNLERKAKELGLSLVPLAA